MQHEDDMNKRIEGKVYVLGDDIDTDQIIPAQHLVYSLEKPGEREKYGEYALSGVPLPVAGLPLGNAPFVKHGEWQSEYSIIVAGKNFGCGSSREHAPAALQIAGLKAVVAPSFARIFYRNAVDGGFLIPVESCDKLVSNFHTGDRVVLDVDQGFIRHAASETKYETKPLGEVENIISAGGIFAYARQTGLLTV